jgi:diguanylate cyclase (GGDEF)-like protein
MGQMFTIFPMPLLLIDEGGCIVDGNTRAEQLWAVNRDAWPLVPVMSLLKAVRMVGNCLVPWTSWNSLKADLLSSERILTQITAPTGEIHRGVLFGMNLSSRRSRYLFMGFAQEQITETGEILLQWAQTDPVTGLYNRAYWLQHQPLWNKQNGLVVMFDVDKLKTVNDLYGHDEGDRLLAFIGRVLRECLLEAGVVVRYGGDEFAAWMPETSPDAARAFVQAVEEALGAQEVSAQLPVKPMVSTGMVAYQRGNLDKAVRDADEAMYEHKGTLLRSQNGGRLVLSRARLDVTTGQTESAVKPGGLAVQFRTEFDQI